MLEKLKNNKYLFIIPIVYFLLGMVHMGFAILGFACMILPLAILFISKKNYYCQGYCPRSRLFMSCGQMKKGCNKATPAFFVKGSMKWIVLGYFVFNLANLIYSTTRVALGLRPASQTVSFLMVLKFPAIPQLFHFPIAPWLQNLSYGFYSMMLTTTILGFVLTFLYRPKAWCTICPIMTISTTYMNHEKKKNAMQKESR